MKKIAAWFTTAKKNWKPLFGLLVAAAPGIINFITPIIPSEYQALITSIGTAWAAVFVKQKNVTGGDVVQKM